ncbi:transcriptional regulator [Halalkalibacter wakoensis JCM 9140]|uniref:Transcriptional regulator n=1 Tax=Halalkalibacter wakoensis JCM 9140 TaxID=1236970 RepID=W4Q1U9_9BACI|nr:FadR/GntR family transcriptional regulator [Halalkalibacter wakoensis]GAE25937.1 transcriptional regulator [Halalkalibacter wakoensis JCM 9140]
MGPKNLSEQLLHDIGLEIVQGNLSPGEILPKVETLSEMKGVSRTVVREALKGLTARRLVESSTRVGTVVREKNEWLWWDPDIISWASRSNDSRNFLLQLSEVRLAIEPAAVRLAARNATDEDILLIKKSYERLENSLGDEEEWARADFEFHDSILLASRNVLMISLVKTLHNGLVQSRQTTIKVLKKYQEKNNHGKTEDALLMHKAVMEAICSRDEALAYEKMLHLLLSVVQLIEDLEASK